MTNDTIQTFIDEQRWRDISEAPRDGTQVFGKCGNDYALIEWENLGFGTGYWHLANYGKDVELREWNPTHFRPIPTDTPADVMQIAIDALREVAKEKQYGG